MNKFKVGDIVKGIADNYGVTNTKMTAAEVTKVNDIYISVKILDHENKHEIGHTYDGLHKEDFELVDNLNTTINEENLKKLKKEELVGLIIEHQKQYNQDYNELMSRIEKARDLIFHKSMEYKIEDRFGDLIEEEILREYDLQELNKILGGEE